jgi:hypothetical protein
MLLLNLRLRKGTGILEGKRQKVKGKSADTLSKSVIQIKESKLEALSYPLPFAFLLCLFLSTTPPS